MRRYFCPLLSVAAPHKPSQSRHEDGGHGSGFDWGALRRASVSYATTWGLCSLSV